MSDRSIKIAAAADRPAREMPETPAAEAIFWGRKIDAEVKQHGVYAHFIEVTPDLAKAWLARNRGNRRPSASIIERYARDMANGEWLLNSQAITFSTSGRLLNGQNRLQACLRAGVPFRTMAVFGLDPASFQNEDTAKKRSRKDRLDIREEERTSLLSAALGWLYAYERGGLKKEPPSPTPAEEHELLSRHPGLRESVRVLSQAVFNAVGLQGMLACLHYLMTEKDATLAEAFFDGLGSGSMIRDSDPVYQLRKRLTANRTAPRKLSRVEAPALVIKAWNLTREGRAIQQLAWRPNSEPFPEVR